ncbi:hypothetical protein ACFFU9_04660 [Mariniflexile ostreae]|uniref:Prophage protein DUF1660 n=1 Tax=Mariniflexile ostreae TaxID=1520892 RepID=A0ABV5F9A7_9FLAO
MKNTTKKPAFIPAMYCSLLGHDYQVTKKVTNHVKEYTCKNCKKQLTTNSNGDLIELTSKFKEINATLERVYNKKMERANEKVMSNSVY